MARSAVAVVSPVELPQGKRRRGGDRVDRGSVNGRVSVDDGSEAKRSAVKPGIQVVIATGNAACRTRGRRAPG